MPRSFQIGFLTLTGSMMLGAGYLIAVRGEVILADIAAIGSRVWCF